MLTLHTSHHQYDCNQERCSQQLTFKQKFKLRLVKKVWRRFNLPIRDTKIQFDNVTSAQVRYDIKSR